MLSSFRNTLITAFIVLLGAALFATIAVVIVRTNQSIVNDARQNLALTQKVFETQLAENIRQRQAQVVILTDDFGFKRAIATSEEDTIISALANHGERIGADMVVLFDTDGNIVVSTHPDMYNPIIAGALKQNNREAISTLTIAEQQAFQLFIAPVFAPDIIAWVGVGTVIDRAQLNAIKQITNTEITLNYSLGGDEFQLSTIEAIDPNSNFIESTTNLLSTSDMRFDAVLATDINAKLAEFSTLRRQILGIAIVALIFATIAALFIARNISRPIDALSRAAVRIARGDYGGTIKIKQKNEFGQLGMALNNMRQAIDDREKHISYQANHDLLTAVPNRYFLSDWIKDLLREEPSTPTFSLAIVHIYNLNQLIDLYGSEICDQLIKRIAKVIKSYLKRKDRIARLDGNQFLLFLYRNTTEDIEERCDSLLHALKQPYPIGPLNLTAEVRIGAVCCPEHGYRYDELMRRAGIALSDAHKQKQVFCCYQRGADEVHLRKIHITNRLQAAVRRGGFTLLFQPQLNLHSQQVEQVEALIRWHDEELGEVYPDEFIPLAESSGDISAITLWTLEQALEQLLVWRANSINLGISLNLSARDLKNREFIDKIVESIRLHDFSGKDFIFEVTESAVMVDPEIAITNLRHLKDQGFKVAMDDFGTGFSSLSQLKSLPINELKIDKTFILGLPSDANDQKIVETTIAMAHHLGLNVIAEGVENLATVNLLRKMDCDIIQGYHLGKPMSGGDIENWLRQAPIAPALFAGG